MPRVVVTEGALRGMERCRQVLASKAPAAAARAASTIVHHSELLESSPEIGRPSAQAPELRELLVMFGDSGYIALYRYVPGEATAHVLAFRHQKEAGC